MREYQFRPWHAIVGIVVLAAIIIGVVVATTGGDDSDSSADAGTDAAAPGEATRGGTLVYARNQEPPTLNPIGCSDNGCIYTIVQIFDQLVEVGPDGIQPGLAESWTTSDDGKTWTFNLREASFSDGTPVTSDDVVFSLRRFADPKINQFYSGLGSSIKSVRAQGPRTVVVELEQVDGAFLDNLSSFVPSIIPKAYYERVGDEAFGNKPVGSGPFQVKSFKRGDRVELVRNPNYWKPGQPYLDGVTQLYIADDNTRMLKVTSGEAQAAANVPYSQVERIDAEDGVNVKVETYSAWDAIWFNTDKKPFDEANVRLALNYATPRQAILDTVLFGNGELANSIIGKVKYWDSAVEGFPYDLDRARELLADSSVPDGFTMNLLIPSGDVVERQSAEIIQQSWAEIGVKVNIRQADVGTAFERWFNGSEDAATFPTNALSSDAPSDDNLAVVFYYSKGGADAFATGWSDPEVDRLYLEATGTADEETRKANYSEIQSIAMEEPPAVPLFFSPGRTALSDDVQGFTTNITGWPNLEDVYLDNQQ